MINPKYEQLLQTARRQFGQYKRDIFDKTQLSQDKSINVQMEDVFKELYKPVTGRRPSEINVKALEKRIKTMTREKAIKTYIKQNQEAEVFIDNFMNLLNIGTTNVMSGLGMSATTDHVMQFDKSKQMSRYAFQWLEDILKEAVYKNGLVEVVKRLDTISEEIIKKAQRIVWILYSEGIRQDDGTINMAEYTQNVYELLKALRMPTTRGDRLIKYMSRNLKAEDRGKKKTYRGLKMVRGTNRRKATI